MGSTFWKRIGSAIGRPGVDGRAGRRRVRRPAVEGLEPRVVLATFSVTSLADAGPGSLRDAIGQANRNPGKDTIDFAPEVEGTIVLASALPTLVGELEIEGPGSKGLTVARLDGPEAPEFRIFTVAADSDVTIKGMVITGGRADLGGGVRNEGTLLLNDVVVAGNRARFKGGGVYNTGVFTVSAGTISGNVASGGAVLGFGPTPIGRGGGIYNDASGAVSVSTVDGNFADREGGGIFNGQRGYLVVQVSTVDGNVAEGFLQANGRVPVGQGGGIASAGILIVNGSTIASNRANREGGGVFVNVIGRTSVPSTVRTSIIADNPGGDLVIKAGRVESLGHNLISDPAAPGLIPGENDRLGLDPLLAPLGDYGGLTRTRPPLPGSPALDSGLMVPFIDFDQRFVRRPVGPGPEVGAFEAFAFGFRAISGDGQVGAIGSEFAEPLVVEVAHGDYGPTIGGRVTFVAPADGPSAALVGGPATIGPDGRAQVRAVANEVPGTYTVVALIDGTEGVAFTLTNEGPTALGEPTPAASATPAGPRGLPRAGLAVAPPSPRSAALAAALQARGRPAGSATAPRPIDQLRMRYGASSRPGTPISTTTTRPV